MQSNFRSIHAIHRPALQSSRETYHFAASSSNPVMTSSTS